MTVRPNSVQARDVAHVLHPYTNASLHEQIGPVVITRGEGIYVFDDQGTRYIEGLSGLFCASLGFSEERLVEAAIRQMRKLPFYHSFGHKTNEPSVELAERLIAMAPAPMSKVFFANSGSEANDTAIKLTWYYHNAIGKPQKKKIISRIRAYHGVTVASASLTGLPNNHRDFDLPIARVLHTECPGFYRFGLPDEMRKPSPRAAPARSRSSSNAKAQIRSAPSLPSRSWFPVAVSCRRRPTTRKSKRC
jgi:4-aminobutyrate--pyruvate transaminase